MPVRLDSEERERRRKERVRRSFSDAAYKHYDPKTEGYGSAEAWIRAAESMGGNRSNLNIHLVDSKKINPDLRLLGLTSMPDNIILLKKAFRNMMFVVHPDYGGTNAAAQDAIKAYERLTKFY